MKLLVRNLPRTTTEADVKAMFEAHGTVQSANLVLDKKTGGSKGFAFVDMPKAGQAKAAMKLLNGTVIENRKIRVKKASTEKQDASSPEAE
jgi:RNA recognition motif-containing protein